MFLSTILVGAGALGAAAPIGTTGTIPVLASAEVPVARPSGHIERGVAEAGWTTTALQEVATEPRPKQPKFRVSAIAQVVDLEDLADGGLWLIPGTSTTFRDIRRERIGARVAFGPRYAQGFVQGFVDDYSYRETTNSLSSRGNGFGIGVRGDPIVHRFAQDASLVFPYHAGWNGIWLDGPIDNQMEFELDFGLGVDWRGLQVSAGIASDTLFDVTTANHNVGYFGDLMYKHPDFPLWGRLRAFGGEIQGVAVTIGGSF